MTKRIGNKWKVCAIVGALSMAAAVPYLHAGPRHDDRQDGDDHSIRHVLLISIDGMHALDFINCSKGISGVNGGRTRIARNLAELDETGVNYLDTATSKPSDSFPGLMALMTGGSPRTVGAFYDVAYDRLSAPPCTTTGNGVAGGTCTPGGPPAPPPSMTKASISTDQTQRRRANRRDGGIHSIDPNKLVRDPDKRLRAGLSRGISSEPTRSSESSTPRAATRHGPTSTRRTPRSPVLAMAPMSTITTRRTSIPFP